MTTTDTRTAPPGAPQPPPSRYRTMLILAGLALVIVALVATVLTYNRARTEPAPPVPQYVQDAKAAEVRNMAAARQTLDRYQTLTDKAAAQSSTKGIDLASVADAEQVQTLNDFYKAQAKSGERTVGEATFTVTKSRYSAAELDGSGDKWFIEFSVCYDATKTKVVDRAGKVVKPLGPDGTTESYKARGLSKVRVAPVDGAPKVTSYQVYAGDC